MDPIVFANKGEFYHNGFVFASSMVFRTTEF